MLYALFDKEWKLVEKGRREVARTPSVIMLDGVTYVRREMISGRSTGAGAYVSRLRGDGYVIYQQAEYLILVRT